MPTVLPFSPMTPGSTLCELSTLPWLALSSLLVFLAFMAAAQWPWIIRIGLFWSLPSSRRKILSHSSNQVGQNGVRQVKSLPHLHPVLVFMANEAIFQVRPELQPQGTYAYPLGNSFINHQSLLQGGYVFTISFLFLFSWIYQLLVFLKKDISTSSDSVLMRRQIRGWLFTNEIILCLIKELPWAFLGLLNIECLPCPRYFSRLWEYSGETLTICILLEFIF